MSQRNATYELHKPNQPLHNRQVIEVYTPHVQIPGVQHKRREEVKRLQTLYKDFAVSSEKGKFVKVRNYKLNIDEWHMDGQVYVKPPFKDPDEVEQEFYKAVLETTSGDKIFKNQQITMQKNIQKRKKLEEEEIRLGYAKPKKNYTGFEEDEDLDKTKKENSKPADSKKQTLKRKVVEEEEEGPEEEQADEEDDQPEEAEEPQEQDDQQEEPQQNEDEQEQAGEPEQVEEKELAEELEEAEDPEQAEQEQADKESIQYDEEQEQADQVSQLSAKISQKSKISQISKISKKTQSAMQENDEEEVEEVDEYMQLSKSMRSNKSKVSQYKSKTASLMDEMLSDIGLE